jgi:excinuclease UvrABC nuclease subunit
MKKEVLNYYLYISWNEKSSIQDFSSYMAVAKSLIKDELSEEIKDLGDNVFVFSSEFDFEIIKHHLKHRKFPYMLVDITNNFSSNLISTYLQDEEIEVLNKFVSDNEENTIEFLRYKMEDCVFREEYESAAYYRDLIIESEMIQKKEKVIIQ